MLPFFPRPYPDELLYSICARYHQRSCNQSYRSTVNEIFGSATACAVADLPNRLGDLCGQLHRKCLLTPAQIIDRNTLLPLFRPFLPRHRVDKLVNWMIDSASGGGIHMSIGAMASSIPSPRFLRLCPECLKHDGEQHGEPYWHRRHQATGVAVCPIHGCWLLQSSIRTTDQKQVFHLVPADPSKCISLGPASEHSHYLDIAKSVAWLLDSPADLVPGLRSLQKRYIHHLQMTDLATFSGRINQKEFHERFVAHYGASFLQGIHCGIDHGTTETWLSQLVRKPRKANHPLRHLLLIHFIGLKPEGFLQGSTPENRPFGRGPWPCLNPAANHYRQPVINRTTISRNSENGMPIGNFFCSCGFSYARTGPDRDKADRYRIGRMISFGQVWEKQLLLLLDEEHRSYRETARILGVDTKTVISRYARLNATANRNEDASANSIDQERVARRTRWLELQEAFPDAALKELRALNPSDFAWLYRNDHEWLQMNVPSKERKTPCRGRVDWPSRDARLAETISEAVAAICESPGRPVRITISSVGRKLGALALLQKKLSKLPATRALLAEKCETRDAFIIRRVRLAVETLRQKHVSIQAWRIIREARIRPGFSEAVADEIERFVRSEF